MKRLLIFFIMVGAIYTSMAQTFTMAKKCRMANDHGNDLLANKKYHEALNVFIAMDKSCKTKDAKEAIAVGKAEAYNGLKNFEQAIMASDAALKVSRNKSLSGYFQKAIAQNRSGRIEEAKATFENVIMLTEKNTDTKARASNYALLAILNYRQLQENDSAFYYLEKAIALDPVNTDFYVQKGDMLASEKKYDEAFFQFDKAVELGKTDMKMYLIRSNTRVRMVQEKYNTTNTQELRSKMSAIEKAQICKELKKAIELGLRDMKQDMFASLVCN